MRSSLIEETDFSDISRHIALVPMLTEVTVEEPTKQT